MEGRRSKGGFRRSEGDRFRGGSGGSRGGFRSRDSGGSSFGGGSRGSFRDRKPLELTEVTCSKCQKQCKVPFKPSSSKPVYCSDCFKRPSEVGGFSDSRREFSGIRKDSVSSDQIESINSKLDKIMRALKIE